MWEHSGNVAIVGLGHSPTHRRWDETPQHSLGALAMAAARQALDDCGLRLEDIDGVISSPGPLGDRWLPRAVAPAVAAAFKHTEGDPEDGISKVSAAWLARNLGIDEIALCEDHDGMVSALINQGVQAVASGRCNYLLAIRPLNNFAGRYQQSGPNAGDEAAGALQFNIPYGHAGPAGLAGVFSRYLWKYNERHENLADLAVNNRRNGLMCEYGYYYQHRPEPLTREDYLTGRWITKPLSIYDCDIPIHVAAAFVITTAERARALKQPPAYVLGIGGVAAPGFAGLTRGVARSVRALEYGEAGSASIAKQTYEACGLGPVDMGFANVYDGYLYSPPLWVEALGFCKQGEGLQFLKPERIAIEGTKPITTSGGNNGVGRSHGISHIYDAVLQVRRQAGPRQVKNSDVGLSVVGPLMSASAQVFAREPR